MLPGLRSGEATCRARIAATRSAHLGRQFLCRSFTETENELRKTPGRRLRGNGLGCPTAAFPKGPFDGAPFRRRPFDGILSTALRRRPGPRDEAIRIEAPEPDPARGDGARIGHRGALHACIDVRAGESRRSDRCQPRHESGFRFRCPASARTCGRGMRARAPPRDQRGASEHAGSRPDAAGSRPAGAGHVAAVAVRRARSRRSGRCPDFPARPVERAGAAQTRVRVADLIVLPFPQRNLAASACRVPLSTSTPASVAPTDVFPPADIARVAAEELLERHACECLRTLCVLEDARIRPFLQQW